MDARYGVAVILPQLYLYGHGPVSLICQRACANVVRPLTAILNSSEWRCVRTHLATQYGASYEYYAKEATATPINFWATLSMWVRYIPW